MTEPITVTGRITGRKASINPATVTVSHTLREHGAALRLDDDTHPDFWLHLHIPRELILRWARYLDTTGEFVGSVLSKD